MQISFPSTKVVFATVTNGVAIIPARSRGWSLSILSGTATIGTPSGTSGALSAGFSDFSDFQNLEDITITATVGVVYYRYHPQSV